MLDGMRRHLAMLRESVRLDRERSQVKRVHEQPEFLPAALEVLETPPSPVGRAVLWLVILFIVIAILWSCIGRVDVVAVAQGKVIPRGRVKVIQSSDYGVVRAIHVSEGQAIKAGAPLIELDPTVTDAEVEQGKQALLTAEIDVARARALADHAVGKNAIFRASPDMPKEMVALQDALVRAKIREHTTALASLREDGAQKRGDHAMVRAEISKLEEQLPIVSEQLTAMESLGEQRYVSRLQIAEMRERVVGMRQDLAIRRAELTKAHAAGAGVGEQRARLQSEFAREAFDALTEAQATRALRAQELKKADEKARRTVLTSPVDGVVQQLQANTLGGVVKPADPLMIIVPDGGGLLVEAAVHNRDIGFVREGQRVDIKLEAFPFTRYGVVTGVVERLSRDAIETEREGLMYPARIRMAHPWIDVEGARQWLSPGLAATAEVKTDSRPIIEYLLSPLTRRIREAARER